MTKTLYFDCGNGVSGDMILGALVDAGLPLAVLNRELKKLAVKGFRVRAGRIERHGITGTQVHVQVSGERQPTRRLGDIQRLLRKSRLSSSVKTKALRVFEILARAEAKVHRSSVDQVHFHEVGAVDAIVDITGAMIGLEFFGVDRIACSPLNVGAGTVRFSHGTFPVPAPATAELLRGREIYASPGRPGELTTPTGAAIVTSLTDAFGPLPLMTVERVGQGAGSREIEGMANFLRVFIGTEARTGMSQRVAVLETQIDDMNPQIYGYVMERLLEAGALDVFLTPIQMKKNRPGILLTVLCGPDKAAALTRIILRETTTIGVRRRDEERVCLPRRMETVRTPYGKIPVKVSGEGETLTRTPEYEVCKRLARQAGVPLRKILDSMKG